MIDKKFIISGEIFVSERDEEMIIETVLGSCVAVAIWDKRLRLGGMNHYVVANNLEAKNLRFGEYSLESLLKALKEKGVKVEDLEASIVGGAHNPVLGDEIARDNILLAKNFLKYFGIKLIRNETGGEKGRKLVFNTYTGEVNIRFV